MFYAMNSIRSQLKYLLIKYKKYIRGENNMIEKSNTLAKQRINSLDILRIICAVFIFIRHAYNSAGFSFGGIINSLGNNTTSMIMTCFFMLSGLSLVLSNRNKECIASVKEIKTFYIKRIISIIRVCEIISVNYHFYGN